MIRRQRPSMVRRLPTILIASVLAMSANAQVLAQDQAADPSASFEETQALIERMQRQVERMSDASRQRDQALQFLEEQIERAAGRLDGSEEAKDALAERQADLSAQLETTLTDQEKLAEEAAAKDSEISLLEAQIAELSDKNVALEAEVAALTSALASAEADRDRNADTVQSLEAENAAALAALREAIGEIESEKRDLVERSRRLLGQLVATRTRSQRNTQDNADDLARAQARAQLLQDQVARMANQLRQVGGLLDESERAIDAQESQIAELNANLAEALAEQVEELSQYRSEFFGRLKEALDDRQDFRIVGDRFVFQSEVLFGSGSARIGGEGQQQLRQLATALNDVATRIPADLDWILRVDGHTDSVPVGSTSTFDSNWDLSTARAISVVQELVREGVAPERLAATGFGEFQPLDPRDDEIAYRRNRRIEFKLTSG